MFRLLSTAATVAVLSTVAASAATVPTVSPTSSGALPASVSRVGGIVLDLIGLNGRRVVSQLAASSLFSGFASSNPLRIGTQSGFSTSVLDTLGGGLNQIAVRISLFDGDTAPGDFDDRVNFLSINGTQIGNFSDVETVSTDSDGDVIAGTNTTGFANDELDTGFFFNDDAAVLASVFASLGTTGEAVFTLDDQDEVGDNFFDFTQGLDASVIDTGTGPVVEPPSAVPLPAGLPLLIGGLGVLGALRRRRRAA